MSANDYFSLVATFIALRETLEAGIIIAVLLGFIEQLIPPAPSSHAAFASRSSEHLVPPGATQEHYSTFRNGSGAGNSVPDVPPELLSPTLSPRRSVDQLSISDDGNASDDEGAPAQPLRLNDRQKLISTLSMQVWTGAILGLACAAVLGGIFLYVFYTFAHDLWQDAENLWEGIFCGIASFIILVMGLAFLRLPHARTKWRYKLIAAMEDHAGTSHLHPERHRRLSMSQLRDRARRHKVRARAARGWILFGLPFITVLREGLEGVVFLGGIGITDAPQGIFFGALVGLVIGAGMAYWLFHEAEAMPLQQFTTFSTIILFMMGSGLASRSAYSLERQYFINGVGQAAAESGDGPGSYRVAGNIWKLTWGNPEVGHEGYSGWWQLAQSLVGWNNIGTVWTVGTYISYWLVIIGTLIYMKYKEGRTELFGHSSKRGREIKRHRMHLAGDLGRAEEEEGLLAASAGPSAGPSGSQPSAESQ